MCQGAMAARAILPPGSAEVAAAALHICSPRQSPRPAARSSSAAAPAERTPFPSPRRCAPAVTEAAARAETAVTEYRYLPGAIVFSESPFGSSGQPGYALQSLLDPTS